MLADIKGTVELPGEAKVLDELKLMCHIVVVGANADIIDVRGVGDRKPRTMPGDLILQLHVLDVVRVEDEVYDPRKREAELMAEISRLQQDKAKLDTWLARAKEQNPEGTYVPALQQSYQKLLDDYATLSEHVHGITKGE